MKALAPAGLALALLLAPAAGAGAEPVLAETATTGKKAGAGKKATAGKRTEGRKVDCGELECWLFGSPRAAFRKVLEAKPKILGVGEYHEIEGERRVRSSLAHFTRSLLPELRGRVADLVVETWVTTGNCGQVEKQATEKIEETTQRPESTANELETMLLRAADLGIQPHILVVTCEEYEEILTAEGELDAERLLQLVTRLLREKGLDYYRRGLEAGSGKMVVIYGGALHNDTRPPELIRDLSFGPALAEATGGGYVELDLLVPEYVLSDEDSAKEPWFEAFRRHSSHERKLLIRQSPDSFLLFPPKTRVAGGR